MNRIIPLTLVFVMFMSSPRAQIVSDHTNDITIKFDDPTINTTLPTIDWIFPRLEYTNSPENGVEIQAEVRSKSN